MGLDRGNSFKFKKGVKEYMKNGAHEIKGRFWIIRHYTKGHYRTLEGKFETEEQANEAYEKWVSANCD